MYQKGTKVGVVGADMVGSSFAHALTISGLATDIVLVDLDRALAESQAMVSVTECPSCQKSRWLPGPTRTSSDLTL